MSSEFEKRLQVLEEGYEYQDRLVETLNQVIISQQAQIDKLEEKLRQLKEEFQAGQTEAEDVNDPPPHY